MPTLSGQLCFDGLFGGIALLHGQSQFATTYRSIKRCKQDARRDDIKEPLDAIEWDREHDSNRLW
jgi:hypothetical protein